MNEDERVKDVARGIALEKRANDAEVGVFIVVWLPVAIALIILGSKYTHLGGWGGIWTFVIATAVAAWASRNVKAKALR